MSPSDTVKQIWCDYLQEFVWESNKSEHQLTRCEHRTVEIEVYK